MRTTLLETPPIPLIVDPRTFDAFAWNASHVLEWRTPGDVVEINALDPDLPLRMAFVLRAPWGDVPTEIARLHVGRAPYHLADEPALAPFGIDDATDQLFFQRRDAHATFWLAADNLNALFWALHDWAHFHNHGEFDERTATELQCDTTALAWLWRNRSVVPIDDETWESVRLQVLAIHERRLVNDPPGVAFDDTLLRDSKALRRMAETLSNAAPS